MQRRSFPVSRNSTVNFNNYTYKLFVGLTTQYILRKWPQWNEANITSYRLQFRAIDIDEDGLIDFDEL